MRLSHATVETILPKKRRSQLDLAQHTQQFFEVHLVRST